MTSDSLEPFDGASDETPAHHEYKTTLEYTGTSNIALYGSVGIGLLVFAAIFAFGAGSAFVAIVLLGLGAALGLFVVPRVIASNRWEAAQLTIDRYPLQLGDEVPIRFHQRSHGQKVPPDQEGPTQFRLTCIERATYTVGTDTRTESRTVVDLVWGVPGSLVAGTYIADGVLRVPIDRGAPSFKCSHNKVEWELTVDTPEPLPSFTRKFDVVVAPTIAERFASPPPPEIQDA